MFFLFFNIYIYIYIYMYICWRCTRPLLNQIAHRCGRFGRPMFFLNKKALLFCKMNLSNGLPYHIYWISAPTYFTQIAQGYERFGCLNFNFIILHNELVEVEDVCVPSWLKSHTDMSGMSFWSLKQHSLILREQKRIFGAKFHIG